MAEMALEIQIERLRVNEITKARDAALQRLSDAYVSVRQKTQVIEQLQQEREAKGMAPFPIHPSPLEERTEIDCLKAHIVDLESTIEDLRFTVRRLQRQLSIGGQPLDPPPRYQENALKVSLCDCFRISKTLNVYSRPQQILLSKRMSLFLLPQSYPSRLMTIIP